MFTYISIYLPIAKKTMKNNDIIIIIIIIIIDKYLYRANSSVVTPYTKLYTIYTLLSWRPCKT